MAQPDDDQDATAVRRARLGLLAAVLDGEPRRATGLLWPVGDFHLASDVYLALGRATVVALELAYQVVEGVDPTERAAMRADLAAELLELAGLS
jgi:hypothetical protein